MCCANLITCAICPDEKCAAGCACNGNNFIEFSCQPHWIEFMESVVILHFPKLRLTCGKHYKLKQNVMHNCSTVYAREVRLKGGNLSCRAGWSQHTATHKNTHHIKDLSFYLCPSFSNANKCKPDYKPMYMQFAIMTNVQEGLSVMETIIMIISFTQIEDIS